MGKGSKPIIGYHYRPAYQHGIAAVEIDAFLEKRAGDRTAWRGRLTASGTISVNAPNLFGGEKDQGGLVGDMDVMFGESTQMPNSYLLSTFGEKIPAWRGFTTVVWKGGRYGAMNPYPKPASYKVERILKGWDNDICWYAEKAQIPIVGSESPALVEYGYWRVEAGAMYTLEDDSTDYGTVVSAYSGSADQIGQNAIDARNDTTGSTFTFGGSQFTFIGSDPAIVAWSVELGPTWGIAAVRATPVCPSGYTVSFEEGNDASGAIGIDNPLVVCTLPPAAPSAANPAHVLYEARTCLDMGREPTSNINEASLQAAADKLYDEGFGICTKWDPANESVEDFENRICRLIGGSFSRSLVDGQWYLDLARGDYILEDLPILTDDDILSFEEQPSTLDSAVNSVSVRYFDPERKEHIVTPPVRALGLVAAFGTIHETLDFPEIPTSALALRVAMRILQERATPTRVFELATTRRTYSWRLNTYFRLQTTKRGIADMVCVVGEKDSGSLRSGAIKMKATQEPSSLPETSFVEVEPGVDTTPAQTPTPITLQRAEEAPYIEVVAALPRADLAALPDDVGFAMAMASTVKSDLDFTMLVDPNGDGYDQVGRGEWCATATIVEAAPLEGALTTNFTLADGIRLDRVEVGMAVVWGNEWCRVDAIDIEAEPKTITLGRACGDTVPWEHVAGERVWFYQVGFGYDATEYVDGESIDIKLLSNTGSQQLPEAAAAAMALTFDHRQVRPYAPGRLLLSGLLLTDAAYPTEMYGAITVKWAHRDRVLQADQLVASSEASVGPEPGTTYDVVFEQPPGTVVSTQAALTGDESTPYSFPADGLSRIAVVAKRDGYESWQALAHTFTWSSTPPMRRITEAGDVRITESGEYRYTE